MEKQKLALRFSREPFSAKIEDSCLHYFRILLPVFAIVAVSMEIEKLTLDQHFVEGQGDPRSLMEVEHPQHP